MREQTIYIPWPPSTNSLWRAYKGRNILSARYRAWMDDAGKEIMSQRPHKFSGPVGLHIELSPPTKRAFDIDNRSKAVCDILVHLGVIEADDSRTLQELRISLSDDDFTGARATIYSLSPSIALTQAGLDYLTSNKGEGEAA